jgi:hypothetical protein
VLLTPALKRRIGCHTFRAKGITDYLKNGGRIGVAQRMAGHSNANTMGLYDGRNDDVNLDEVERIQILVAEEGSMKGTEVFGVLNAIGATHLHHANSVTTSCTFLEQGGLASRGFVECHGLSQTPQYSDGDDKKYGIWDRIFLDYVDIHYRGGRVKGPNQYGPALFVLDLGFLAGLPAGFEVLVTKKNPVNWRDNEPDSERWFEGVGELAAGIKFGEFGKMLVIKTPSGRLEFPKGEAEIFLDDPKRQVSSGEGGYAYAEKRLRAAAAVGKIKVSIKVHGCRSDCSCVERYAKYSTPQMDFWFT